MCRGGSGGVCALWPPALPFSMLIDACSAFYQAFGGTALSEEQQRVSAERVRKEQGGRERKRGLSPCVSGDSRNNEKVCWDFKANGWSFPVVMADMGRTCSGNKHTDT